MGADLDLAEPPLKRQRAEDDAGSESEMAADAADAQSSAGGQLSACLGAIIDRSASPGPTEAGAGAAVEATLECHSCGRSENGLAFVDAEEATEFYRAGQGIPWCKDCRNYHRTKHHGETTAQQL